MSGVEISADQLAALTDVLVIDVREPDEYAEGHVPDARNIPLGSIGDSADEVRGAEAVYVICQSGRRSSLACETLGSQGIRAVNVAGGTTSWIAAGLPVQK